VSLDASRDNRRASQRWPFRFSLVLLIVGVAGHRVVQNPRQRTYANPIDIDYRYNFERRIGLHPAGFDSSGQMYVDTRFGDFPHWLPTKPWGGGTSEDLFTGWMLLSYRKAATASSTLDTFPASRVTDENPRTFWVARQNRPGEWLTIDLGRPYDVKAIQVNYADYKSGLYGTDSNVVTQFRLQTSVDGVEWKLSRTCRASSAIVPTRTSSLGRRRARASCGTSTFTLGPPISPSATSASSAMVLGRGRRRRPISRRGATATSATP